MEYKVPIMHYVGKAHILYNIYCRVILDYQTAGDYSGDRERVRGFRGDMDEREEVAVSIDHQ